MTADAPILPGAVLGLFGGGQLGRMFAHAASRLGYRVHVFAPEDDPPAAHACWRHTRAAYEDLAAVRQFARQVAAITYEFENVPVEAAEEAARHSPVSPQPHVLRLAQHRVREKTFLDSHKLPVAPFAVLHSEANVTAAMQRLGEPVVLKTVSGGYDGKGQRKVDTLADASAGWTDLGASEAVAEGWVSFEAELSMIVARNPQGQIAMYGPMHNVHRHHILDYSVFPASLAPAVQQQARELATAVAEALELIGVCCIEMFLTRTGDLLINELAPRPHNSGHLTIEGHRTSQFEQQVRTMCGLPLGSTDPVAPAAAMANLLGDVWQDAGGEPDWSAALAMPGIALHLYGKTDAPRGRKMGHLTALADTADQAVAHFLTAHDALRRAAPVKR